MKPPLTDATLSRIRDGWADELEVPSHAFEQPGAHVFVHDDSRSLVMIELGDSQVIVGPSNAVDRIEGLTPDRRHDLAAVVHRLEGMDPDPIGVASLAYVDRVITPKGVQVAVGPVQNIDLLRDRCTPEEWEESGLIHMPARIAARRPDGKVAAVAGYERWGRHLAQLGVLTDPELRGQGYAASAAARAAQVAQNENLIPQWRCRVGNVASLEVADRLGFHEVGRQLIVLLPDPAQS
ncbi:GNAT family N-acetyltransferase [Nocardioides sp. JQ2195]|uniref:GNAT family N-acetyltransferase n=1 Tax=Nocardioides sp. JQ2195 TaxID=2592334 RepID=UPI00143E6B79|nr:GNAT family protein [Nocardioides sp. JQ2195]QIX26746.1 GNAT family N-acetyltransferase [Nocardioides sp. JQ2195]